MRRPHRRNQRIKQLHTRDRSQQALNYRQRRQSLTEQDHAPYELGPAFAAAFPLTTLQYGHCLHCGRALPDTHHSPYCNTDCHTAEVNIIQLFPADDDDDYYQPTWLTEHAF